MSRPFIGFLALGDGGDDLTVGVVKNHGFIAFVKRNAPLHLLGCALFGDIFLEDFLNGDEYTCANIGTGEELALFET